MILVLSGIERNEGLSETRLQAARHMYNTYGFILMQSLSSEDRCKEIEEETVNFLSTLAREKGFLHVKKSSSLPLELVNNKVGDCAAVSTGSN